MSKKQLLDDLIWNLRSVETEGNLTDKEKQEIRKSLVDEYTETVRLNLGKERKQE